MVDPALAYALPRQTPQAYWDQPLMRHSPQRDPYHRYPGMSPYPMGDGALPPAHGHFPAHNPYYTHTASPYLQNAGLAPPSRPSMCSQSPHGVYMMPQRSEGGQGQADFGLLESDVPSQSNWGTLGYSDKGSAHHLQTPPLPGPPLPPKPVELVSTVVPTLATSEQLHLTPPNPSAAAKDALPLFDDRQMSLDNQQDPSQDFRAVSPPNEAPEALAPFPLDKTCESPEHVPHDEVLESPAVSQKTTPGIGGCPTTKALGLIEQGFNKISAIIEGLAEVTGKPPSDLYRRLERTRKGSSKGHLWNIYLYYFACHEEEAARIKQPLERTQAFRSLCYAQYKEDHSNFQELLETYQELEMATVELTVGQCKREVEKYEKKLRDMVSTIT